MQGDLLWRGTEPLALGRRAIALLRVLVERPGAVVSKDALIEAAWPAQAIEESNLTVQIAALRKVLGEVPGGDRWIETMPRRGYRFIAPVVAEDANAHVQAIANDIRRGKKYPALIAVNGDRGGLILVEGHARATAYVLAGLPSETDFFLASSSTMNQWAFY